jgi:hypothetical protein
MVEQDVVPMRRVQVFDCFEMKTGALDLLTEACQFLQRP